MSASFPARLLVFAAISAAFSGGASAIGLGKAVGTAIIGEQLGISVEIIGDAAGIDSSCFRVVPSKTMTDSTFSLPPARTELKRSQGSATLHVTTKAPISSPVLEFAIDARCEGTGVSRDYMMLAELPQRKTSTQPQEKTKVAPPEARQADPGQARSIDRDISLNALARQFYPDSREMRDVFRDVVAKANPGMFPDTGPIGGTVLKAGTKLRIPDVSQREQPKPVKVSRAEPAEKAGKQADVRKEGKQDKLVVGAGAKMSAKETAAALDRLERMLTEQIKFGEEVSARIGTLTAVAEEARSQVAAAQERYSAAEKELAEARKAAKIQAGKISEMESEIEIMRIVAAILGAGAAGGFGMHFFLGMRRRQEQIFEPQEKAPLDDDGEAPEKAESLHARMLAKVRNATRLRRAQTARNLSVGTEEGEESVSTQPAKTEPDEPLLDKSAIDVAKVMESMGLAGGAVQTLADHARNDKEHGIEYWLELVDVLHRNGLAAEKNALYAELRHRYNVQPASLNDESRDARNIEDFPHVLQELKSHWPYATTYVESLVSGTRDGTRTGFPRGAMEDIVFIRNLLRDRSVRS